MARYRKKDKNRIYYEKDLGEIDISNIDYFIDKHMINQGFFRGLYTGCYFRIYINGKPLLLTIAGFDLYRNRPSLIGKPHIVCIPHSPIIYAAMNTEKTALYSKTPGNNSNHTGFPGSDLFNLYLPKLDNYLESFCFGKHLLKYDHTFKTPDGEVTETVRSNLLDRTDMFGTFPGSSIGKLPLYVLRPQFRKDALQYFWLSEHYSNSRFYMVDMKGTVLPTFANVPCGVRPKWVIG